MRTRTSLLIGSAALGVAGAVGFGASIPGLKQARSLLSRVSAQERDPAVEYDALPARPSFAREAGEFALAGTVPTKTKDGYAIATFAGGCFWGTELHFARIPGVVATCVGYTQGRTAQPTYGEVCSGRSGHTEACQLVYDPAKVTFTALCAKLFETIDPTLRDQVGRDYGTQYRHGIYAHTPQQLSEAQAFVAAASKGLPRGKMVVTELKDAGLFWPAEGYHQNYLARGGRFGSAQSAAKGCTDKVRCYG